MLQYLNLLRDILNNGVDKEDRTGTGTRSVFGRQMRFDLSEGFPLLTTRPIWFRGIVEELIWFLRGSTNAYDLPEAVQKWWLPWSDSNGDLGPTYGQSLRAFHRESGLNEIKQPKLPPQEKYSIILEKPDESDDEFVGQLIDTPYGMLQVLNTEGRTESGHRKYRVQFQKTGTVKIATKNNILRSIKDRWSPTVAGVGYLGETIVKRNNPHFFLYSIWQGMLKRCYDKNDPMYPWYGAKGVTVHPDWHNFSVFYRDVQELTNWCYARQLRGDRIWHLDKDYYGSSVYSRTTCVWLSREDNALYTGTPIVAVSPEGHVTYHVNQRACSRELGLSYKKINKVLKGQYKQHKGYCFEYTDKNMRQPLPFDQVGWLLNEIRTNPNSRRLVLTTWCASRIGQCRLPPCHGLVTQFNVTNGKLSCSTYQRSCDVPVGVPANIASYALLTHIFAEMTGLEVGDLVYTFGDAHIYQDQIKKARLQIERTPTPLPTLKINNWGQGINDWSFDDFELMGYEPQDQIQYPVSV